MKTKQLLYFLFPIILLQSCNIFNEKPKEDKQDLRLILFVKAKKPDNMELYYRLEDYGWEKERSQRQYIKVEDVSQPIKFTIPNLQYLIRLDIGEKEGQEITIDSMILRYKEKEIKISSERISNYFEITESSKLLNDSIAQYGAVVKEGVDNPTLLFNNNMRKKIIAYFINDIEFSDEPFKYKKVNYSIEESSSILSNAEKIKKENGKIIIQGWCINKGQKTNLNDCYVIVTNEKNDTLIYNTKSMEREDVTIYFNDGNNYDNAGFVSQLPLGLKNYKLYLGILNKAKKKVYFTKTQKIIE